MAIMKKDVKASDKVKQAQLDKKQKEDDLSKKIEALKEQSMEAARLMGEAADSENLSDYSKHKEEKRAAEDAIDFYQARLDSLSNTSLFGKDTQAMLSAINQEQKQITLDAMAKIVPLFDQAYAIAEKARAEYISIGELIPTICNHTGISTSSINPDDIVGVLRVLGYYVDPHNRDTKWGLADKK